MQASIATFHEFKSLPSKQQMLLVLNTALAAKDKTFSIAEQPAPMSGRGAFVLLKCGRRSQFFKNWREAFDHVFPEKALREAADEAMQSSKEESVERKRL
ncbi:hypothetical protein QZM81_19465 [Burkholderia cepacia]|uniref:hypothetical protein n=1 Tax=Burkholderia cepacia TaxID=292 RepID=UPI00264A5EC0|nr:hypothetical protein [Burkholderia cepacia]MDN7857986.1 hypothetical protein [Burkholderia cepacia]